MQRRTDAGRRATPLPWTATLIAPSAFILAAVLSFRTDGFVSGMLLGICIALAIGSGVVVAVVRAGSGFVRTLPAADADRIGARDAADLAVLDELEPLRSARPGDHQ